MACVYQKTAWQIFHFTEKSYCLLYNAVVLHLNSFHLYSLLKVFKQMHFLKYIWILLTVSSDLQAPLKCDRNVVRIGIWQFSQTKQRRPLSCTGAESRCSCKVPGPMLIEVSWWSSVESNGSWAALSVAIRCYFFELRSWHPLESTKNPQNLWMPQMEPHS